MAFGSSITAVFGADTAQLSKGSTEAEGIVSGFASKAAAALGALGVTIGAAAIVGFFKTIIDKGGALQDLSDRLQVGTDELQSFDFAVRQAGGTTEQANQTWDKSRKALDSLAAGQEASVKQFAALGLKATDFIGLDLPASLDKIAKAYSENIKEAGAYDAVTDILGSKSAPQLNAVLLKLGAEGFPAFVKGAKDANQVMGKESIAAMDEFGDRIDALKGRLTTFGAGVFSAVQKIADVGGIIFATWRNAADGIFDSVDRVDYKMSNTAETIVSKVNPAIKKTAEELKQIKEIEEARAKLADYLAKSAREQLEPQARISAIQKEIVTHSVALAAAGADEKKQLQEKLAIAELDVAQKKLIRAEEAKFIEATRLGRSDEIELVRLSQKAAAGLTAEEGRRLEILRLQQEQLAIQYEIKVILAKGVENLTDGDKARLNVLFHQGESLEKQIEAKKALIAKTQSQTAEEKAVAAATEETVIAAIKLAEANGESTEALKDQLKKIQQIKKEVQDATNAWLNYHVAVSRTGKNYADQTTNALEGVRARLIGRLSDPSPNSGRALKDADRGQDYGGWLMANTYQGELAAVERELAQRKSVAAYARQYGEDAAVYKFGDDLAQRALADLNSSQIRTTTAVEQIARRFNAF